MKKILSIAVLLITAFVAQAQKVTFYSPAFETGVRSHIGLGPTEDVLQAHTDTITRLDLSALEISDIRDAVYLKAVTKLNLSYNKISDVSPLISLTSLRELNLSHNKLENINILAFTQSESMEVDVSNNHISDFSYFYTPMSCDFSFIGMGIQSEKNAPYFNVYQFYADLDEEGVPIVRYRGLTNTGGVYVECGEIHKAAQLDGDTHTTQLAGVAETTEASVTNGTQSISTYVVPLTNKKMDSGESVIIETGLPAEYVIQSLNSAQQGTMQIEGTSLRYTASENFEYEEFLYAYYQESTLKGFSKVIMSNSATAIDGQTLKDSPLVVTRIGNGRIHITCHSQKLAEQSDLRIYNASGVIIYEERIDTTKGLNQDIQLGTSTGGIIIIQLESGKRIMTEKAVM